MIDIATPHPPTATDAAQPLSGMVVGDAAPVAPRLHDWPGTLFIGFGWLMTVGSLGGACVLFLVAASGGVAFADVWRRAVPGVVLGSLQWRLVTEVRRFSRWGWYGAMAELGAAAAMKVLYGAIMPGLSLVFLALLAIDAGLMRYFWKRRAQFDVDLGG